MSGSDEGAGAFSYVDIESRVPAGQPLRTIEGILDDVLISVNAEFERLYQCTGR